MSSKELYNVVTDTVTGPNVRWRDNLFQGIAVVVFAGIGALVGHLGFENFLLGLLGGLVLGVIVSGGAVGIYRAWRHSQGKHD